GVCRSGRTSRATNKVAVRADGLTNSYQPSDHIRVIQERKSCLVLRHLGEELFQRLLGRGQVLVELCTADVLVRLYLVAPVLLHLLQRSLGLLVGVGAEFQLVSSELFGLRLRRSEEHTSELQSRE